MLLALLAVCPTLDVEMMPSDDLQIVAWIEDTAGNYVDTIYITQSTGVFGLGNRPGVFGFNSGPAWPYGKRLDVFPVWSHKNGHEFPTVIFQSTREDNLAGGPFTESSRESHYCRPIDPDEAMWDTGTCASAVFTDKGKFSDDTTGYPPRSDVTRGPSESFDVVDYAALNPFDTISRATPLGNQPLSFGWHIPATLPDGDYMLRVEVSKEFDQNATYDVGRFPIVQVMWAEYGMPYRGQPAVIYDVPFVKHGVDSAAATTTYAGYADPDALDGEIRSPDGTIDNGPGTGAGRLLLVADPEPYRVRATYHHGDEAPPPLPISDLRATVDAHSALVTFGPTPSKRYEIRYRIGEMTEQTFDASGIYASEPYDVDGTATFLVDGLLPATTYSVGVRAIDDCEQAGPLVILAFTTDPSDAEVGCCDAGKRSNAPIAIAIGALLMRRRRRVRR